eukprot:scaffold205965_cov18-Tisochrysis_lutea.AAC.2
MACAQRPAELHANIHHKQLLGEAGMRRQLCIGLAIHRSGFVLLRPLLRTIKQRLIDPHPDSSPGVQTV